MSDQNKYSEAKREAPTQEGSRSYTHEREAPVQGTEGGPPRTAPKQEAAWRWADQPRAGKGGPVTAGHRPPEQER